MLPLLHSLQRVSGSDYLALRNKLLIYRKLSKKGNKRAVLLIIQVSWLVFRFPSAKPHLNQGIQKRINRWILNLIFVLPEASA